MSKTMDKQDTAAEKPSKRKAYLRRALYFIVVLTLILLVTPYIIRYKIIEALRDAGAESVQIEDVDYNPFTAFISINQLLIINDQKQFLRVSNATLNVGYFPILRRRFIIYDASLQDADILIEQDALGEFTIAGINILKKNDASEAGQNGWQAGIESLSLANTNIRAHINKQEHLLHIKSAKLEKLRSWEADNNAHLSFSGALDDAKLELDINLGLFGDSMDVSGSMHLDTLELNSLVPDLYGQLTITGNTVIKLQKHGRLKISNQGEFIVMNAKYSRPELIFNADDITIAGKNSFTLDNNPSDTGQIRLTHSGSLSVNQLSFIQPETDIELLRFKQLLARRINIQGRNQIELQDISLIQAALLRDRKSTDIAPAARTGLITIDQIKLEDMDKLKLANIVINKLELAIKRDEQGELSPLNRVLATKPATNKLVVSNPDKSDIVKDQKNNFRIILDSLKITGESTIKIDDESIQPAYRSRLRIQKAELGQLDNTRISQPTPFLVELLPEKFGYIKLSGNVYPFTPEVDLDLEFIARAISLPRLTPYLSHYTGHSIRQGLLDSDTDIKISAGELTGQINIVARNLEMAPVSSARTKQVHQQLGIPLEQALAMLRDSDNIIKLEIPVSGNLSKPDFSFGNAINIAISKAIKTGARSYLLYALGPYGIALALTDSAINSSGFISLSDIEYEAGQTAFPEDQHDYLKRLQKITLDRPEIDLHLCAHATEQDRLALIDTGNTQNINQDQKTDTLADDTAILKLAELRMDNLKNILTTKYAVKQERIILCKPFLDGDKNANPHIEVSL